MDFGEALKELRKGSIVCRQGWNGMGMSLHFRDPASDERLMRPYLFMLGTDGVAVVWTATHTDLLAEDWQLGQSPGPSRRTLEIMGTILDERQQKALCGHKPDAKYACEFASGHEGPHDTYSGKRWDDEPQQKGLDG